MKALNIVGNKVNMLDLLGFRCDSISCIDPGHSVSFRVSYCIYHALKGCLGLASILNVFCFQYLTDRLKKSGGFFSDNELSYRTS